MTDARDTVVPGSGPDPIGFPSIMRSDDTLLSPGQPGQAQLPSLGLPGYEFIREIHRGGQGVVYLALQRATHRRVAIKIMKEGPFAGPDDRARFDREVRILAHLKHPSIVAIHDSGSAAGCDYFVMDYIEGQPLDEYLKSHPLPIPDLVELFRRICEAVQSAHERGVIHRDLKPGNIRIDRDGVPYILDFGLAKMPGSAFEAAQMTQTGLFIGSLPWASPEQAEGHASMIDTRTDVYSLGVIFYTALTGHPPYSVSGSVTDAIRQIVNSAPARPSIFRREIESDLETIILKCLQKEPQRRYANSGEIASDLGALQSGQPISAKRDSTIYVVRKRARRWLVSNPLAAYGVAVLVGFLFAQHIARPIIYGRTHLDLTFRRVATRWASPVSPTPELRSVRVIALTDNTNLSDIAAREKLSGVSTTVLQSARRLHGRLMEKLANVAPRAVAFDLFFSTPSEYDEDFIRGVRALQAKGVDVVTAVRSWDLDSEGLPQLSPAIAKEVRWGAVNADLSASATWALDLLLYRNGSDPRACFALTSFAAYRHPTWEPSFQLEPADCTVVINYWKPGAGSPQSRRWLNQYDSLTMTTLLPEPADDARVGIHSGDLTGVFALSMPPQPLLDAATINYADVFTASREQLEVWFADRAVIIGDFRPTSRDLHPHPDGRIISGTHANAVAIESMLSADAITMASNSAIIAVTITGAVVGAALAALNAALVPRRRARWLGLASFLLVATIAALGLSLTLAHFRRYLCNPSVPIVAMFVASALAINVRRDHGLVMSDLDSRSKQK